MAKIGLDEKFWVNDMQIISVFSSWGGICCSFVGRNNKRYTFREILTKAKYDFENPTPTFIIIESPLGGTIYQIGNAGGDEDNYVWEHGNTKGYA